MAIKAPSKVSPEWYVPISQRDDDQPAKFLLRPLTPTEYESVMENVDGMLIVPPRNYASVLRLGIKGWANMIDDTGAQADCNPMNHDLIPGTIRVELAGQILLKSRLTETETKN